MCKPLIIIRIDLLSRALTAFWKRSPHVPVLLMEMVPGSMVANAWEGFITASLRSIPSFNRTAQVGKFLPRKVLRGEAFTGFSRGSGRS
ncbi:Secreted protein [Pseudomonas sp. IT-P258]